MCGVSPYDLQERGAPQDIFNSNFLKFFQFLTGWGKNNSFIQNRVKIQKNRRNTNKKFISLDINTNKKFISLDINTKEPEEIYIIRDINTKEPRGELNNNTIISLTFNYLVDIINRTKIPTFEEKRHQLW